MGTGKSEALKTVGSAGTGAVVGVALFELVGSVGVAVGGSAFGLTVGPFIAIGAGIGAAGYGIYWLGKQVGNTTRQKD